MEFPEHPDVVFKRAPLVLVLCQVKFPPILSLLSPAGVAGFQEAIRNEYPELNPEGAAGVTLSPDGIEVAQAAPVWRMATSDGSWRTSLSTDFIALETTKYRDADEFVARFGGVLEALGRTLNPEPATRTGLRKINELRHPAVKNPRDWVGLLRPEVLGVAGGSELPGEVSVSFAEDQLVDGKEILTIRHGALPDSRAIFRLDFDFFTTRRLTVSTKGQLLEYVREFAAGTTAVFHWCLERSLFDWLGPVPRMKTVKGSD